MATLTEYKCPSCGGVIEFDSQSQKMKCPYCSTEFDVETVETYNQALYQKDSQMSWQNPTGTSWHKEETAQLSSYLCHSCGGEIITDKNTFATNCPYCDNKVVLNEQVEGILRPHLVIPFQYDKQNAMAALKKHFEGKKLLPPLFKNENHLEEIKGIYVPYWLYDCDVEGDYIYRAQRTRSHSDGNYNYTYTDHFMLKREGDIHFQNIPADGSAKMADDLMDSLEPFDYNQAVDFNTAYLAGYFADRYDVLASDNQEKINQRIMTTVNDAFYSTTHSYGMTSIVNHTTHFNQSQIQYALLPVWLLNTTWNNQKYVFVMNGQTGKLVGDLPMDKKLYWKYFGIYFGIGTIITAAISLLFV